jgi:hypothetical protein
MVDMAAWTIRRRPRRNGGLRVNAFEGVLLALGAFFFLGSGLRQATIGVDTGHAGATDSLVGPLALAALPIALALASFALRAWLRRRRGRVPGST